MKTIMATALILALCLPVLLRAQVTRNPDLRAVLPAPPAALSPAPGESRSMEEPLTFRWAPVSPVSGMQPSYHLVITPVFSGQTPAEALDQNQPLFSRTVSGSSYEYEPGAPTFRLYPMAVGFAWQVQAVDTGGHPVASNLGKSEVSSFTIISKLPPPRCQEADPRDADRGDLQDRR